MGQEEELEEQNQKREGCDFVEVEVELQHLRNQFEVGNHECMLKGTKGTEQRKERKFLGQYSCWDYTPKEGQTEIAVLINNTNGSVKVYCLFRTTQDFTS